MLPYLKDWMLHHSLCLHALLQSLQTKWNDVEAKLVFGITKLFVDNMKYTPHLKKISPKLKKYFILYIRSLSYFVKFHDNGILYLFYLLMLTNSQPFRNNGEEHYAHVKL
jgi:hypothetical protein